MGEMLGLPEWAAVTIFVVTGLALWLSLGFWRYRRAHRRVAARRANPTEVEFLAMMAQDCSSEAAQFLWDQTLPYVRPALTPHPDDDLIGDLSIDDGDISMDWPSVWAERRGLPERSLPNWPQGWPLTVRNFGRWLDMRPR